jgi:hypothetical protein
MPRLDSRPGSKELRGFTQDDATSERMLFCEYRMNKNHSVRTHGRSWASRDNSELGGCLDRAESAAPSLGLATDEATYSSRQNYQQPSQVQRD